MENTFDARAAAVKTTLSAHKGFPSKDAAIEKGQFSADQIKSNIVLDLKAAVRQVDALRSSTATDTGLEMTFAQFANEKWGIAPNDTGDQMNALFMALGVNPNFHSMEMFNTLPQFNENYRWLIPEVIREAVRLGLRDAPIYSKLIVSEQFVSQPTVYMPQINMSDVPVADLNEIETIPTGTISFGQKTITLTKHGTGIKLSDEVNQYVPLNVLSLYLQDVGVKLGLKLDRLAMNVLINGDQADGSAAAPVIGVENTTTGFQYIDLLRAWLRMGRLGRTPDRILSNENPALQILQLPEFKGYAGDSKVNTRIQLDAVIPSVQNYSITGFMPVSNQIMLVDTSKALIKFNATALKIEGDRIVEKGLNATYLNVTTGFASMQRDARLLIDKSVAYSSQGFPSWMEIPTV